MLIVYFQIFGLRRSVTMTLLFFSYSVLLHAYMRDYTTCNAIAHIWLRNPRNESCRHYNTLVEIYLTNVVIPQKKWKDVQPFLDSCQGLTLTVKEEFQRYNQQFIS